MAKQWTDLFGDEHFCDFQATQPVIPLGQIKKTKNRKQTKTKTKLTKNQRETKNPKKNPTESNQTTNLIISIYFVNKKYFIQLKNQEAL